MDTASIPLLLPSIESQKVHALNQTLFELRVISFLVHLAQRFLLSPLCRSGVKLVICLKW